MNANLKKLKLKIEEALKLADKIGEVTCAIHLSTAIDVIESEIKKPHRD